MKLFQKYALGLLFFAALFMTACSDDDPVEIDPTLELTAGSEYDGDQLQGGDTIKLGLNATAGTHDLSTLIFYEDGVRLPNWEDRLLINDETPASNALALQGNSVDGFTMDVDILANTTDGEHDLAIEVTDAEENTDEVGITYTTVNFNIDTLMGVLLNQDGPEDTGGLDLDNGESTGTVLPDDDNAEIRDQGIDLGDPPADNWIQRIAPFDDAEMAAMDSEFDFAAVTTESQIIDAFDDGTLINESDVVQVGDVFAVRDNGNYYLILITEVNVVAEDNSDNYVIDIKKTR